MEWENSAGLCPKYLHKTLASISKQTARNQEVSDHFIREIKKKTSSLTKQSPCAGEPRSQFCCRCQGWERPGWRR